VQPFKPCLYCSSAARAANAAVCTAAFTPAHAAAAALQVGEVVIVCDPSWRYIFEEHFSKLPQGLQVCCLLLEGNPRNAVAGDV
jgi:hypothetical protein